MPEVCPCGAIECSTFHRLAADHLSPSLLADADASIAPSLELCFMLANLTQLAGGEQLDSLISLLTARLPAASAASEEALIAGLAQLQVQTPELYAVVDASRGQNASQPATATPRILAAFYADPWAAPAPAKSALASRMISAPGVTAAVLVARAEARMQELEDAEAVVQGLPEVQQALNLTQPGSELPYDYTTWAGGSAAYATCNLARCAPSGLPLHDPVQSLRQLVACYRRRDAGPTACRLRHSLNCQTGCLPSAAACHSTSGSAHCSCHAPTAALLTPAANCKLCSPALPAIRCCPPAMPVAICATRRTSVAPSASATRHAEQAR